MNCTNLQQDIITTTIGLNILFLCVFLCLVDIMMQHFNGYNPATLGAMGAMYSMHQQAMQMHPGYRPSTHALSLAERLAGKHAQCKGTSLFINLT